jgi:hypothetical protein
MRAEDKIGFIREKATEHAPEGHEKILWSSHAVKKLVEDYAMERRPLPGCLVLGFVGEIPLHCVIAIDRDFDRMVIVTAYRPAKEKWDDDWQKRKK